MLRHQWMKTVRYLSILPREECELRLPRSAYLKIDGVKIAETGYEGELVERDVIAGRRRCNPDGLGIRIEVVVDRCLPPWIGSGVEVISSSKSPIPWVLMSLLSIK
jgi:hypothetical protein